MSGVCACVSGVYGGALAVSRCVWSCCVYVVCAVCECGCVGLVGDDCLCMGVSRCVHVFT